MLDGYMRTIIDQPLNDMGALLVKKQITANQMTLFGLVVGLVGACFISQQLYLLALICIGLSRLADGLDGAIARQTTKTDFGGYLDIVCDFLFYGAIPFAFIIASPDNHIAGGFLLLSFYFNGATFLAYAIMAEKLNMQTTSRGSKSLYFTGGLAEGTETIAFFVLICLIPSWFTIAAYVFGIICFITAISRVILAYQVFNSKEHDH